jgi:hypothetical protein
MRICFVHRSPVATGSSGHCSAGRRRVLPLNVATGAVGYLSSSVADATGHGTPDCPWLLRAAPGQRINITLLEFDSTQAQSPSTAAGGGGIRGQLSISGGGRLQGDASSSSSENEVDRQQHHHHLNQLHRGGCAVQLAVIREHPGGLTAGAAANSGPSIQASSPSGWETIVCSSTMSGRPGSGESVLLSQRESTVYLSTGNELEVTITRPPPHVYGSKSSAMHSTGVTQQPPAFLLRYEGIVGFSFGTDRRLNYHSLSRVTLLLLLLLPSCHQLWRRHCCANSGTEQASESLFDRKTWVFCYSVQ